MTLSTLERMPDFAPPVPVTNGKQTINLPTGRAYERIVVDIEQAAGVKMPVATMKTEIIAVRLLVDGDPVVDCSAEDLLDLQEYYGTNHGDVPTAGKLPIYLALPWLRTAAGAKSLKLGTKNVRTVTLELRWVSGGITAVQTQIFAARSANEPLGVIRTIRSFQQNSASAGQHEIPDLRRNPRDALMAMHVKNHANNLTSLELLVNNTEFYEGPQDIIQDAVRVAGRSVVSGVTPVDFARNNVLSETLPFKNVNDFRLRNVFDGAPGSYSVLMETLEGIAEEG